MYLFHLGEIKISFGKIDEIINKIVYFLTLNNTSPHQVVTLNSLIYLQSKLNPCLRKKLKYASLITCDSYWIALICSFCSLRILKHQPGVEMVVKLLNYVGEKSYTIYLFGSEMEVVESTAKVLKEKFKVNIVGYHHGYIFSSKILEKKVIEDINKCSPDILLVGLPTELQENWICENINKLNCKVVIGIGGSFDILSGKLRRAPKLFRKLGLEWYYRMLQQPWRVVRILKLPLAITLFFFDCLSWRIFRLFYK